VYNLSKKKDKKCVQISFVNGMSPTRDGFRRGRYKPWPSSIPKKEKKKKLGRKLK
jgi:hypothetical protein